MNILNIDMFTLNINPDSHLYINHKTVMKKNNN